GVEDAGAAAAGVGSVAERTVAAGSRVVRVAARAAHGVAVVVRARVRVAAPAAGAERADEETDAGPAVVVDAGHRGRPRVVGRVDDADAGRVPLDHVDLRAGRIHRDGCGLIEAGNGSNDRVGDEIDHVDR